MTAGGGLLAKKTGKSGKAIKELENSRWFQSDRDDVLSNINKSLTTATITNAVLAGATAHGAGKAATDVVEEGGKEVLAEGGKSTVKGKATKGGFKYGSGGKMERLKLDGSGWKDAPTKFGTDYSNISGGVGGYAESTLEKVAVPDMAKMSGGAPANMFGKLKKAGGEVGDFLTTKPEAGDYKQLSLSNLFTQDKGLRSQFGRDFVGNLRAGAAQFIPGENSVRDALRGGGTLNDWIAEEDDA
jgi:hypothetical protein